MLERDHAGWPRLWESDVNQVTHACFTFPKQIILLLELGLSDSDQGFARVQPCIRENDLVFYWCCLRPSSWEQSGVNHPLYFSADSYHGFRSIFSTNTRTDGAGSHFYAEALLGRNESSR